MAKPFVSYLLASSFGIALASPSAHASVIHQIEQQQSTDFSSLMKKWEDPAQSPRFAELSRIATDRTHPERTRYIALMGAAQTARAARNPRPLESLLISLQSDPSWVIRSAVLRLAADPAHPPVDAQVRTIALKMLKDPALVIRTQAVAAIESLRPAGAEQALAEAALDARNHHGGKALWVPQKALQALIRLEAGPQAWSLLPLLDRKQDPALIRLTLDTLSKLRPDEARLISSKLPGNASLSALSSAWRQASERYTQ